jgi:predicted small secreted protein
MRRSILLAAVVVCAAALLTACGPRKSRGVVGMSVDDAGTPVIVLQNCDGDISQLEFYDRTRPRTAEAPSTPVATYVNPRPDKSVVQIAIQTGGNGWQVTGEAPALRADGKYVIQAWGKRHEWSGRGTEFTLGDLETVEPGQIRHNSPPADATPPYDATPSKYRVTSLGEFITDECP